MTSKALLTVAVFFFALPSVFALNCTLYQGENNDLCGILNPLDISESQKQTLMQENIYGETEVYVSKPESLALNVSSVYNEEYSRYKFRIVDERLFNVTPDFPKIIRESFRDDIPSGVNNIEYSINLDGYDNLCIAKYPDDKKEYLLP